MEIPASEEYYDEVDEREEEIIEMLKSNAPPFNAERAMIL